jgi:ankyrin repeat protein
MFLFSMLCQTGFIQIFSIKFLRILRVNKKLVTPLINAVMNNQFTKVIELLHNGADPNGCEDKLGYSPLHYAAAHSGVEIATLLVRAGANLEAQNSNGDTPLNIAFQHQNRAFAEFYRQVRYRESQSKRRGN